MSSKARARGNQLDEKTEAALEEAIRGRTQPLFRLLEVGSGLPGTRLNIQYAQMFADACSSRGKKADRLVWQMAKLTELEAPGATAREFLPVCGVLALGLRAANDKSLRKEALAFLHDAAADTRFRVREVVPTAITLIGTMMGEELLDITDTWMDGYFQAAAVIRAITDETYWLSEIKDPLAPVLKLDEAFILARDAPRSAARWPGRKALIDALVEVTPVILIKQPMYMPDQLTFWAMTQHPEMRDVIERILKDKRLARHTDTKERVRKALKGSAKPERDPTLIVKGTRGRGKKRGKR